MTAIKIFFGFITVYLVWRSIQIMFRRDWVVKYRLQPFDHTGTIVDEVAVRAITNFGARNEAILYLAERYDFDDFYIIDIEPERPERTGRSRVS